MQRQEKAAHGQETMILYTLLFTEDEKLMHGLILLVEVVKELAFADFTCISALLILDRRYCSGLA